jgi:hypothetical protein
MDHLEKSPFHGQPPRRCQRPHFPEECPLSKVNNMLKMTWKHKRLLHLLNAACLFNVPYIYSVLTFKFQIFTNSARKNSSAIESASPTLSSSTGSWKKLSTYCILKIILKPVQVLRNSEMLQLKIIRNKFKFYIYKLTEEGEEIIGYSNSLLDEGEEGPVAQFEPCK